MSVRFVAMCAAVALMPAATLASDFTDYRIPAQSWRQNSASFGGSWSQSSGVSRGDANRDFFASGSIFARSAWYHDSDPSQWDATIQVRSNGTRRNSVHDRYDPFPLSGPPTTSFASGDTQRERRAGEGWSLSAGLRQYPWELPVGFSARGVLEGDYEQNWFKSLQFFETLSSGLTQRSEYNNHTLNWTYEESGQLDLGAGYGRVRDASTVFAAILLEERLARDGVLERPVSASARRRLAELFSLRDEFSRVHFLSEKFFWREVERVLREDGALGDAGLSAFDLVHAQEKLAVLGRAFPRGTGWYVGPLASGRHLHRLNRFDQHSGTRAYQDGVLVFEAGGGTSNRSRQFSDVILLGGVAEYHRPLGRRTQLDAAEQVLVDRRGESHGLFVQGQTQVQHLIGERWAADAGFSHTREIRRDAGVTEAWEIVSGGGVSYFLEDFWRFNLRLDQNQNHYTGGGMFPARRVGKNFRVSLGVTVGRGRLDAPGLLAPVRPLN